MTADSTSEVNSSTDDIPTITLPPPTIEPGKVKINVSGHQFVTTTGTLLKYPNSKLGQFVKSQPTCRDYFFESDPIIFGEILKLYHQDELHCPRNVCYADFLSFLTF